MSASILSRVRDLVARRPVFDAHVDSLQRALDLGHDLGEDTAGHFDLAKGTRGGLGAVVFVSWVDPLYIAPDRGGARARTENLLRQFHELLKKHPDKVAFAGNGALLDAARANGQVAGIPGIEGGHSIEESLAHLEWFFERGVRVMTLVWNNHLSWIRSCQDGAGDDVPAGLSDFGREVVRRMNALGMVVDVSHAGERSFHDVLEVTTQPVIASHSGCMAVNEHPRNLTDDQLRALAANGGVAGMVFCTPFLDAGARVEEARVRATPEYQAIGGANETEQFLAQSRFLQEHAAPLQLESFLDHLEHAVEIAGIEHVGIGSDFDGIWRTPVGLEDASCYGNLAGALLGRGLAEEEVLRILGGNMERVFRTAAGPESRAASAPLVAL